jgi:precorrin-6B methylase 2
MNQAHNPTPENIMKTGTAFWASKVLLTAVRFQLFTMLAQKGTMPASEIKSQLGLQCSDRHVYDFLDALTSMGFLKRDGLLETATYSNSPDTDLFLDQAKPSYVGGMVEMLNNRLYKFWGHLDEGLLTGMPQNEAKDGGDLFKEVYASQDKLRAFVHAMSGVQMGNFMAFSQAFDFSKANTLIDIGGSSGLLSLLVAKHQPHMTCISWDLPEVAPIASETIAQFGLQDRVKAASGDFFKDDLPTADILVMGNILHDWDEETKIMLMQKAYAALPQDGVFVAIENVLDPERIENTFSLLMSLNMLIETGNGFEYTLGEFTDWAKKIGFKSTALMPLAGPTSAALAYK